MQQHESCDNIHITHWPHMCWNVFPKPLFSLSKSICRNISVKLLEVNKVQMLIPWCTAQLTTAAGLVQKCTVLPAVGSDLCQITFSPQTNSRVCLEVHQNTTSSKRSWYTYLVFHWSVQLLHSHLSKRPEQVGKQTLVQSNQTKWGRCESPLEVK